MITQQSSSSIDSRLLTVATRWNASSCIIETDVQDCDHNFARLRLDHLDYPEYCSFFTRFALVSSYDEAQTLETLSHNVMCKESNEDDTEETLQNKQKALTSLQVLFS